MQQSFNDQSSSLLANYSEQQLTDLISCLDKPERPGLYLLVHGKTLYRGKFDGTRWLMYQASSSFHLTEFQLKSMKWRGLNFDPTAGEKTPRMNFSGGFVFDWNDPRGPRPLTDND